MKLEATLTGVAGEYFVAAELTLRKYVAAVTLRNSRGTDIIATTSDGSQSFSIQVKTNSSGNPRWILTSKSEGFYSDSHYYVFVALSELGLRPDFHIVPSEIVAKRISESHQVWLTLPKKDGTARKDSSIRNFSDNDENYLERWDLLETGERHPGNDM